MCKAGIFSSIRSVHGVAEVLYLSGSRHGRGAITLVWGWDRGRSWESTLCPGASGKYPLSRDYAENSGSERNFVGGL